MNEEVREMPIATIIGIALAGTLAYLGLGVLTAGILAGLRQRALKKAGESYAGLSRLSAWGITLAWPLLAVISAMFVALALAAIGAVIGFVLAILAAAIVAILTVIALIIAAVGAVIAFVIVGIAGLLVLGIAFCVVVVLAIAVFSPFLGLGGIRDIATKFHPIPEFLKNKEQNR